MEPRIDLISNEIGAKIAKRIYNISLVIEQSPLPKATLVLMSLRASQINGCGWCVNIHTKDAAAAGETPVRLSLVAAWRESTVFTEAERPRWPSPRRAPGSPTPATACPTRPGPRCASTTTTTRSSRWSAWSP